MMPSDFIGYFPSPLPTLEVNLIDLTEDSEMEDAKSVISLDSEMGSVSSIPTTSGSDTSVENMDREILVPSPPSQISDHIDYEDIDIEDLLRPDPDEDESLYLNPYFEEEAEALLADDAEVPPEYDDSEIRDIPQVVERNIITPSDVSEAIRQALDSLNLNTTEPDDRSSLLSTPPTLVGYDSDGNYTFDR